MIVLNGEQRCQYEGCDKVATCIACGREGYRNEDGHPAPGFYCQAHGDRVADEQFPEYCQACPNCGCWFGVN